MSAQGPQHVVVAVKFGFAFLLISFLPWVKVHVHVYMHVHIVYTLYIHIQCTCMYILYTTKVIWVVCI